MMKHIKLFVVFLGISLLALARPSEHIDRPAYDRPRPDPVVEAARRIKESCHENYRITYYTNTKESRSIGENNSTVIALFDRGDLECDYRGGCLYMVEVAENGQIRFMCGPRE